MDYKQLGKRLKEARTRKSLSQEELAELVGLSSNHISHVENASTKISLEALVKICNALEVTPDLVLLDSIYKSKEYILDEISILLKDASDDEIKLISRLVKAVIDK